MSPLPNGAVVPGGDLRYVYFHWTGGDDSTAYEAYHLCIARRSGVWDVVLSHDPRDNMRDVTGVVPHPYAAHTAGRNSYALGVAVCAMRDASPSDFGPFPLCDDALELACRTVAEACAFYGIPVDARHVRTHAEAAVEDGYFGCDDDQRWDVARFAPSAAPLIATDARDAGERLRARIRSMSGASGTAREGLRAFPKRPSRYEGGPTRSARARLAAATLWGLFAAMVVAWTLLTWHPWIDWFGRPR